MLLLGKSHGQRSLAGYSPWGCKESDTTEVKQASKQITCSCWVGRFSNSFMFDLILSYFILLNSGKEPPASGGDTGDTRSIPGLVRSPAGRHGNPLQFSCLKNPMNRGAWQATVHGGHRVGHDWSDLACIHTLHCHYYFKYLFCPLFSFCIFIICMLYLLQLSQVTGYSIPFI